MKTLKNIILIGIISSCLAACNLFGYDLQKDYDYQKSVIDPATNKSVLEFLNSRKDIFSSMLQAIDYAGLDTLYTRKGNSYILLTNKALNDYTNSGCYFKKYPISKSPLKYGSKWSDYDVNVVREFLKYHVVKGSFPLNALSSKKIWVPTYATGDTCKMSFVLTNDRYASLNVQTNVDNIKYISVIPVTSGLKCTNSEAVHVFDAFIVPPTRYQLAN